MSSKAFILDSRAASRSFSFFSCFKRFSLARALSSYCFVRCSMSSTGRQFNNSFGEDFVYVNKRRQGGNVETHVDLSGQPLDRGRESEEAGEVVIAVVRSERNQEQQSAGQKH